jgi:hypothetical protein
VSSEDLDRLRALAGDAPVERLVSAQRRYLLARRIMGTALLVLGITVAGLLLVLSLQTRGIAQGVESCVVPGGVCYDRATRSSVENTQNLQVTRENRDAIRRILAILEREYPDAAEAVRAELEGSNP